MHLLGQNLRFVLRQLGRAPGFTATIVLTLALGIGVTTAMFSLVEGILLRPLPFREPDSLVLVGDPLGAGPGVGVTAREIGTYASASRAFSSLGGYARSSYELSGGAEPEEIKGARLTAGVLPTLGVLPVLGRVFTAQEEAAQQPLAVISYALWMNRYHRDPHVLGAALVLDRTTYTIIGVMPRSFEFPMESGHLDQAQLWVPMSVTADELSDQNAGRWGYNMVGRLADGTAVAQAAQDTDRVARQIMRDFPAGMSALHIRGDVVPLREDAVGDVGPLLRTLFFASAVVLLLACANAAGLLLVRAIGRRREYGVRLALGARPGVILRESMVEGLVLSAAGGLVGLGFAALVIRTTLDLLPESMPRVASIAIDGRVVAFAMVAAVVTGILCSLAPAFSALQTSVTESLKDGVGTGTGSGHTRLRSVLVMAEIAIALVLLTVAGAFLRSFEKMRAVDPGFRPDHVLVAEYQLPLKEYASGLSAEGFNRAVMDRLSNKPGVMAAGMTNFLPATGGGAGSTFTIEGVPAANWKLQFSWFSIIDGDYFRAMGITLLDGRVFTRDDRADTPLVVIVNESMARHCWPGQRAIGKRMHAGNPKKGLPWATVVGLVADTKRGARDEANADQWYFPAEQPATLFGSAYTGKLTDPAEGYITLRSTAAPEQMTQTLRATVAEIDPLLALKQVQAMDEVVSNIEAPRRFNTDLITAFAMGALLLAITGIYAVVAFSVSLRAQEIAIRIALGAERAGIARLVLVSAAKLALAGCGLGLLGSLAISRLLGSFLFDVSATDPLVYVAASGIMLLMTLLASALPARRAASGDAMTALRST